MPGGPPMSASVSLDQWADALRELERSCPWPGPRPLDRDDADHLLVGRAEDTARFRSEVSEHRLVFLAGPSGVGKSSLLEVGLLPTLTGVGMEVLVCRDWSGTDGIENAAQFLADKLRPQLLERYPDADEGADFFWWLDDNLGERAVLILDQFEELLRYAPVLRDRMFALILRLNHETDVKIVLSFRDEFLHRLRDIENGAAPFSMSHVFLEDVDGSYAEEVVTAANTESETYIDPEAAQLLAAQWQEARTSSSGSDAADPFGRVGLLHLQSVLYSLHADADGEVINTSQIEELLHHGNTESLFLEGLLRSIEVKLDRCRRSCELVGIDPYLREGTHDIVARSVRHLSAAGYKLVREGLDLLDATMAAEIETLVDGMTQSKSDSTDEPDGKVSKEDVASLLQAVLNLVLAGQTTGADLLSSSREQLIETLGAEGLAARWRARLHDGAHPAVVDPGDVTAGPMLGLAPASVLLEEARRFAFALAWLRETQLVRISTPGQQGIMLSLVHDGFGEGLLQWSGKLGTSPSPAVHALTATRGLSNYWHRDDDANWEEFDGGDGFRVLANLRWRAGWISARFHNVVFVNGDFRGSFFQRCTFEGVTFVNCLLDGAMFSDCTIVGKPGVGVTEPVDEVPVYLVEDADPRMVAVLAAYRGSQVAGQVLASPRPGLPAVPLDMAGSGFDGPKSWQPARGGVAFYGGRISTFSLRSCAFDEGGAMALRQVVGSGFDVVEQASGELEITNSALRHLTFTPAVSDVAAKDAVRSGLEISAKGSVLAQVWLADTSAGSVTIDDCKLVQVWNGAERDRLAFTAKNCKYLHVVNVDLSDDCSEMDDAEEDDFAAQAVIMDYRRNPALRSHTP